MGILLIVGSVISAVLSQQFVDEFKAWAPWLIKKLVELAVRCLPKDQQERYAEEWSSHVDEIPGDVGRILVALGLFLASVRIRYASRKKVQAVVSSEGRDRKNGVLIGLLFVLLIVRFQLRRALVWTGFLIEGPKTFGIDNDVLVILVVGFLAFFRFSILSDRAT